MSTRKVTIPIYDGDDFERLSELRRDVAVAERKAEEGAGSRTSARAGDDEPDFLQEAKDAFDAFVDEAAERAEMWVLNPIGHEEFRELLKAHPPRTIKDDDGKDIPDPDDDGWDVDTETFPKALLLFVDPDDDEIRTVVEPKFDTEAQFRRRLKRLSVGEFESIWVAAYQLNSGAIADPKHFRFSPAGQRSSET